MLEARKEARRLSTVLNTRLDIQAPQKQFEKTEAQIDKTKRETKAKFEREQRQLEKQLESLGVKRLGSKTSSGSMYGSSSSRKVSTMSDQGSGSVLSHKISVETDAGFFGSVDPGTSGHCSRKTSTSFGLPRKISTMTRTDLMPEQMTEAQARERQTEEQCNQYRFLYETALLIFTEAEAAAKQETQEKSGGKGGTAGGKEGCSKEEEEEKKGGHPKKTVPKSLAELRSRPGEHQAMLEPVSVSKKLSKHAHLPDTPSISVVDDKGPSPTDPDFLPGHKTSLLKTHSMLDAGTLRRDGSMVMNTDTLPAGAAVNMMLMVRAMAGAEGPDDVKLDEKAIKILKTIMEESRNAVKTIKAGCDVSRIHDKLIRKLSTLLDMLKTDSPSTNALHIPPEELLNCGYLRLSKENVERLEELLISEGIDPGIHCHSDIDNINIFRRKRPSLATEGGEESSLLDKVLVHPGLTQPVPIYQSKQGAPLDKKRNQRPQQDHDI